MSTYAYITPAEFLGETSGTASSTSSSSSSGLPPIPDIRSLGGGTAGDIPIPCITQACLFPAASSSSSSSSSQQSSQQSSSTSSASASSSSSSPGFSSSSSQNAGNNGGGGNNNGGSGINPNYVLYGNSYNMNQYPYYQYPPYQPYPSPYPVPPGGVIPGTPVISVRDPRSGAPLSNTGPAEVLGFTVLAASAIFTYKRARRAEARAMA